MKPHITRARDRLNEQHSAVLSVSSMVRHATRHARKPTCRFTKFFYHHFHRTTRNSSIRRIDGHFKRDRLRTSTWPARFECVSGAITPSF